MSVFQQNGLKLHYYSAMPWITVINSIVEQNITGLSLSAVRHISGHLQTALNRLVALIINFTFLKVYGCLFLCVFFFFTKA